MALTQISTNGIKNNTITGTDLATNIDLADNQKIRLGTGDDLQIYHDGSKSVIADTGTGGLFVAGSSISLTNANITETMLYAVPNGAVELYYNNSKKFETTNLGAKVTGELRLTDHLIMNAADDLRIYLGASNDLQIYHDGSNSTIKDSGTGALNLDASLVQIHNADATESLAKFIPNGAVELYYNNSKKFETTSSGVKFTGVLEAVDNQSILLGNSDDFRIRHTGSHSEITDEGTGDLRLGATRTVIGNTAFNETQAMFIQNGAVELYHDGSKKFETTSTGATIHGDASTGTIVTGRFNLRDTSSSSNRISWQPTFSILKFNNNYKAAFGDSSDLQIYHDGSHSYIKDAGTGQLRVLSNQFRVHNAADTETMIAAFQEGAVKLMYDNSTKLETTNGGGTLTGDWSVTNDFFWADNGEAVFGTGGDLKIYHNGSASYISDQGTGELILKSNSISFTNAAENEYLARFFQDSAVELYFNGSKKFHTKNAGVYITGDIETSGDFYMLDNEKIRIGHSQDLEIYHDSSSSVIKNLTNDLYVQSIADVKIRTNDSELAVDCTVNGSVALYYDASKKLETSSSGISVTGSIATTGQVKINDGFAYIAGTGNDLQIFHDGSHSRIYNSTGHLSVRTAVFDVLNADGSERMMRATADSGCDLFFNGDIKLSTRNTDTVFYDDIRLGDNLKINIGTLDDLQIYHDGSHSYIEDSGTGVLHIATSSFQVVNAAKNEFMIKAPENGAVNLYYDNGKKFETRSDGVKLSQGHFYADDHSRIKLGDGQDLELYHDGTNSSIKNTTGDLYIYDTGGNIYIQANTPEQSIIAFANGSTELYYDNSIRIRTQSYGIEYHNQQHKFMHTNSGGVGAYLSLMNPGTAAGGKTGVVFGIGNSNAILDGTDYGEGQIKCFTDSGLYGNLEFNLHVGANRSWMKIVGNGAGHTGAGAGTEGMRGGVAFGCAGIAIDRSWTGQPGIHVFNTNSEGDTDQGTFRFHGWNRSYASYPASSGSDFSVNLVADGSGLSSDERRKTGIATITNALDTITKMRGVSFQFVNRELDPQTHMSMDNGKKLGFIAQEVIPLLPQLILDSGEKNVPLENGWCDRYSMDYSGVTAVLVEAIKELAAKVASLESKITE